MDWLERTYRSPKEGERVVAAFKTIFFDAAKMARLELHRRDNANGSITLLHNVPPPLNAEDLISLNGWDRSEAPEGPDWERVL